MRIDEALRIYLSEFRLPGEAPLISSLLEHFAAHWRVRNFVNFMFFENYFFFSRNVIIFNLQIMMPLLV